MGHGVARLGWAVALLGVCALASGQGAPAGLRVPPSRFGGVPPAKPSAAIPATAPTAPQPLPALVQQFGPPAVPVAPARRARVEYRDGLVTVTANNSSLNQILREIAKATGMTITGGVVDERVFGTYGPGSLTDVLQPLLNGTGSNMLLVEAADRTPEQLILTPRQGDVSPPNPMSGQDAPEDDLPPQLTPRRSNVGPADSPPERGRYVPPPVAADALAPVVAQPAPVTEQSPNGVKTPQQIYDELMKMQQQQKKAPR